MIKDGWVNRETGKKSEPRMQFTDAKQLQDVLSIFAKKLILLLNISDLETDFIHKLSHLFQENKGDNTVSFEVMELEKTKRLVAVAPVELENEEVAFIDENEDSEMEALEIPETSTTAKVEEVEEIKVVTKLTMPSRKLKIKISNELLVELEKMQINFKLN
jgi:DNA polymerase-3 subunit alpha